MNNSAGLFGGLLIGAALLAAYAWSKGTLQAAWSDLTATAGSAPASSSSSTTAGAGIPAPNSGSFGTYNSYVAPVSTTSPYQLTLNPLNGLGIQTAAVTDLPIGGAIAQPQNTALPLAPTLPPTVYA